MFGKPKDCWLSIAEEFGSPVFVYDEAELRKSVEEVCTFPHPFGFTARFALKALPTKAILQLFHSLGLHFDVSSGFEIKRALLAGIPASNLSLSSQELPTPDLLQNGVKFNACSLKQLTWFGTHFPGDSVGIRFNPGQGSGGHIKTNVGGKSSAFGIWHENADKVQEIANRFDLKVIRIHTHIGSGNDSVVWEEAVQLSLNLVKQFPEVTTLNLGGGFKVDRLTFSPSNLHQIGNAVCRRIKDFAEEFKRELHLEIEPGTYITALSGVLLTTVQDLITTGSDGHTFIKLDSGMSEILRPTMYDALHPFKIISKSENISKEKTKYSIVGHCCESGDLLTLRDSNDQLVPVELESVAIDDLLLIGGAGAYCSSMCAKNYNSFPEVAEVLIRPSGETILIRAKQTVEQIVQNELSLPGFNE